MKNNFEWNLVLSVNKCNIDTLIWRIAIKCIETTTAQLITLQQSKQLN